MVLGRLPACACRRGWGTAAESLAFGSPFFRYVFLQKLTKGTKRGWDFVFLIWVCSEVIVTLFRWVACARGAVQKDNS